MFTFHYFQSWCIKSYNTKLFTGENAVWLQIGLASWSVYAYSECQGSTAANDPRNPLTLSLVPCRLSCSHSPSSKMDFVSVHFWISFFRRTSAPMPWPTRRWISEKQREAERLHRGTSQSQMLCMPPPGRAWYSKWSKGSWIQFKRSLFQCTCCNLFSSCCLKIKVVTSV